MIYLLPYSEHLPSRSDASRLQLECRPAASPPVKKLACTSRVCQWISFDISFLARLKPIVECVIRLGNFHLYLILNIGQVTFPQLEKGKLSILINLFFSEQM